MNVLGVIVSRGAVLRRTLFKDKSIFPGVRTLFSDQYLGIDKYADSREITSKQYGNMKENFLLRMKQQASSESNMIFTEDLKTIIHLADDTEEELGIVEIMIRKFHGQNKELRFGTFIFGPVVLRLLHHLRKTDLVLRLMNDEVVGEFFDQIRSYVIAMDLLYESGHYQEVLKFNERIKSKQLMETTYPRDCLMLTTAACYKLNTPESYEYATKLVSEARQVEAIVVPKAIYFVSALALNQGRPDVAMELLSGLTNANNPLGNNLKLVTLARLGRLQDALSILRRKVEMDIPVHALIRGDFCQSSIDTLKEAIDAANDTETSQEFEQLCKSLNECSAVSSQTIEGLLSVPIVPRPFVRDRDNNVAGRDRRDEPFFRRDNRPRARQSFSAGMMNME